MTNVDVAALAAELAPIIVGGRFEKAWQPGKDTILLRLRRKGLGKIELLFELGRFLIPTQRPPVNPEKPSMVAQTLRSALENARISSFTQIGFDRLLRLDLERGDGRRSLIFELFGDGNMLLLDSEGIIVLPMRGVEHGARRLRKGELYLPPPGASLPFDLDIAGLRKASEGSKDIVRALAVGLGFGPLWAEEICLRAGVDKKTSLEAATDAQWGQVRQAMESLGRDIARNDLAPAIVFENGTPVDAVPFVMAKYPAPKFAHEQANTFRAALDTFFVGATGEDEEELDDPRRGRYEEARAKIQFQLNQVDEAIGNFNRDETEAQANGDALYGAFQQVQGILDGLNQARTNRSWEAVEATLLEARKAGNAAAQQIVALFPHEGKATLAVQLTEGGTRPVDIDLRRTVQENAETYYAAGKKARSRREGALEARIQAEGRMKALESKGLDGFGAAPERPQRQQRHFWFESYRWTVTPSGLIAVGGRNAAQNDAVVKKYLREGDRYIHADAHGAPSVVLRPAEGSVSEYSDDDLRAACQFAACASRAWRQGGSASAYWVTQAQVSKTPNSGEFVPRGAWMVHGRRNTETNLPLEWAVGVVRFDNRGTPIPNGEPDAAKTLPKLAGGTPSAIRRFAPEVVILTPGTSDPNEVATTLAERFNVTLEEAQAALPAGPMKVEGGA